MFLDTLPARFGPIFPIPATPTVMPEMEPALPTPEQRAVRWSLFALLIWVLGVGVVLFDIRNDSTPALRHPAIIDSAYLAFALWAGAMGLMATTHAAEWISGQGRAKVFRITWLLAALMFALHVAVSFQFAHRWQHGNAFRHVEEVSGFGPGIFVSYGFTLLWLADGFWAALFPASYFHRSPRLGLALHGFMTFIVLNGTVVFGHGFMRIVSALVLIVLLVSRFWLVRVKTRGASGSRLAG